jgi:hypothetical protein
MFTFSTGKNENLVTNVTEFVDRKAFPAGRTSDNDKWPRHRATQQRAVLNARRNGLPVQPVIAPIRRGTMLRGHRTFRTPMIQVRH